MHKVYSQRANTSVIQSVHHQRKFSEELYVIVRAEVDTKYSKGQFQRKRTETNWQPVITN